MTNRADIETPAQTRIGEMVRLYRTVKRTGIREMAREIGISHGTLSRIERGYVMDANTLIILWTWLLSEEQ